MAQNIKFSGLVICTLAMRVHTFRTATGKKIVLTKNLLRIVFKKIRIINVLLLILHFA